MESDRPCHIKLIFKAGIDLILGFCLPPPEKQFHDGIDSYKESILWTRCLGARQEMNIEKQKNLLS
jgi:hypothetical protein